MAGTISSVGIGSGLDANSIITKLTDIEKQPLTALKAKATKITAQLSAYGNIKSQVAALGDTALTLGTGAMWNPINVSSTNSAAVTGLANGVPAPGSFSVEVQQLARAQTAASEVVAAGTSLGTGSLTIQLGSWNSGFGAFTPGSAAPVTVNIGAGEDSLASIARKINDANAGVSATIITDTSGQRLSIKSTTTGAATGFRIQASDDDGNATDNAGLSRLAFDPAGGSYGMATTLSSARTGQDAMATLNGVVVTSSTNTFTGLVPGLNLQVNQATTAPVEIKVAQDTAALKKTINSFVDAFNALNKTLTDLTSYDAANKTASLLQGDSSTVNLQYGLRRLVTSTTTGADYSRLADLGITLQRDGSLAVDGAKLDAALQANPSGVKKLFTLDNANPATDGFGVKLKAFTRGLLSMDGALSAKSQSLQKNLDRNASDQQKVNDHVTAVQAALQKQYSALDAKMGSMTALNQYVSQQITLWNKSGN